jgi:hypothetical protein
MPTSRVFGVDLSRSLTPEASRKLARLRRVQTTGYEYKNAASPAGAMEWLADHEHEHEHE